MTRIFLTKTLALLLLTGITACGSDHVGHGDGHAHEQEEAPQGPNGGRLLTNGDFSLELALFESGLPPEYRVWAYRSDQAVAPEEVTLKITLTRLGGKQDVIGFAPQEDFLRGDTVIYEPHSFVVDIEARQGGETHRWTYDSFEGRTRISREMANTFGLETELAGNATIRETRTVYGQVLPDQERVRAVSARFDGTLQSVNVAVGERVRRGQALARVESNESLQSYTVSAPINGVVTERNANPGEQTAGRMLFTILDTASVWVELAVFPADRGRVGVGTPVRVTSVGRRTSAEGVITRINSVAEADQSVLAYAVLENPEGLFVPGSFVTGALEIEEHAVPLAVRRIAVQAFRDFKVVYAQIGDEYEVRMLELGRQDDDWVEVLGGLEPGTRYVTTNSYLVKADIEKSGAVHEH